MTRELRANLIFLIVLVCLCAPGFVILMKKKLNGSSEPNHLPVPAPSFVAYMQPPPFNPRLERVEPDIVREWVVGLAESKAAGERANNIVRRDVDGKPVVSDGFVTQLIDLQTSQSACRVSLLRWGDPTKLSAPPQEPIVMTFADGQHLNLSVETIEAVNLPTEVRHALQKVGYVDPPKQASWIIATAGVQTDLAAPESLRLTTLKQDKPVVETIDLKRLTVQPQPGVTP